MKTAIQAVIGGVVVYIVATTLISTMITGTGTGDTLITTINRVVAFSRKAGMKTLQIRGNLNAFGRMAIAELSRMADTIRACGETRWSASLKKDDGIVRTLTKVKPIMSPHRTRRGCHFNNPEGVRLIIGY